MAEETSAKQIPERKTEMAGNKIKIPILCLAADEGKGGRVQSVQRVK